MYVLTQPVSSRNAIWYMHVVMYVLTQPQLSRTLYNAQHITVRPALHLPGPCMHNMHTVLPVVATSQHLTKLLQDLQPYHFYAPLLKFEKLDCEAGLANCFIRLPYCEVVSDALFADCVILRLLARPCKLRYHAAMSRAHEVHD